LPLCPAISTRSASGLSGSAACRLEARGGSEAAWRAPATGCLDRLGCPLEEHLGSVVAALQNACQRLRLRTTEVVARPHLVSPALQLGQVLLEFLEFGVDEVAVLGLAREVLQQAFGFRAISAYSSARAAWKRTTTTSERSGSSCTACTRVASPSNASTLAAMARQRVERVGSVWQDAHAIAQVLGPDLLDLTPDSCPLSRRLRRNRVDQQQPASIRAEE
jgi:hypothetical protein